MANTYVTYHRVTDITIERDEANPTTCRIVARAADGSKFELQCFPAASGLLVVDETAGKELFKVEARE